jgi:DNA-binding FadR family transcriptional regulator
MAVRNVRLSTTITRYSDQVLQVRHVTLGRPAIQRVVVTGFEAILDALARHDPVAAQDTMLQFVLTAERDYIALVGTEATDGAAASDGARAMA